MILSNASLSDCFRLMPFGAGRRICGGERFAKNRFFLVVAGIMQRFHLQLSDPTLKIDPSKYKTSFLIEPPNPVYMSFTAKT